MADETAKPLSTPEPESLMSQLTIAGVVREILNADPNLPADEVIRKAKARGLTATPQAIREAVYNARSELRKAGKTAPTGAATQPVPPVPTTAAPTATKPPSISSVIRSILATDLTLAADEVIKRAKAQGLTAPTEQLRRLTKHIRSDMKKAAHSAPSRPVPAAAREVPAPQPVSAPVPVAAPPAATAPIATTDLAAVLANVALVDRVLGACGGAEPARQIAEAVRACGGVDAFLQHVELVAGIRGGGTSR